VNDASNFLKFVSLLPTILGEIFLTGFYGARVIEASTKLSTSLFHTEWTQENRQFRTTLIIFMENAKKPLKLMALGIFEINLMNFRSICNFAYSLFAVFERVNR